MTRMQANRVVGAWQGLAPRGLGVCSRAAIGSVLAAGGASAAGRVRSDRVEVGYRDPASSANRAVSARGTEFIDALSKYLLAQRNVCCGWPTALGEMTDVLLAASSNLATGRLSDVRIARTSRRDH